MNRLAEEPGTERGDVTTLMKPGLNETMTLHPIPGYAATAQPRSQSKVAEISQAQI